MLLPLLAIIALVGTLQGKPVISRNVSDCSITVDGILHYHGKHAYSKFEHECLSWTDLQTVYPGIIAEPNFFNDASIKDAKNYCRNPNMNVNGPWCFVQDEETISMEGCGVCQSLARRPTLPTETPDIEEVTDINDSNGFFQNARDELRRYGMYIRERVVEFINRMNTKFQGLRAQMSQHFNY